MDDESCEYAEENYNCEGDCIADLDCLGECGGDAVVDDCGECNGEGPPVECWDGSYACEDGDCPDEPVTDTVDILFDSDADIYGFQFDVAGVSVLGAGGGASAESGSSGGGLKDPPLPASGSSSPFSASFTRLR